MLNAVSKQYTNVKNFFEWLLADKVVIFLILVGVAFQVSVVFPSGTRVEGGYVFWGAQYHDALWHISLMNKLSHFSFENPVFAGETIRNYHYLMNLFLGLTHRVFKIPLFILVYKIFPVVNSLLLGILTYVLSYRLFDSRRSAFWSVFFVYFGSSFAYFLPALGLGGELLETAFWSQQQLSIFFNLPFAASLTVLLASCIALDKYLSTKKRKHLIYTVFLLGILPSIKSFSIVLLGAIGLVGGYSFIVKKQKELLIVSLLSIILAAIVLLPTLSLTDSHLIFQPGWFLESMMVAGDRIGWEVWKLRLEHFVSVDAYHWIVFYYGIALVIFVFGNLGTRIIALASIDKSRIFSNEVHQLLLLSSIIFLIIPLLFLTSGIAWNSIQFLYYFLFIMSIYAGDGASIFINKIRSRASRLLFMSVLILATIPVSISTLDYYYSVPGRKLSNEEYQLLRGLRSKGSFEDRILTLPLDKSYIQVPAVSGRSTILGDELMAVVPGHDYRNRLSDIENKLNKEQYQELIEQYEIKWIYINHSKQYKIEESGYVHNIYSNNDLRLYKVKI